MANKKNRAPDIDVAPPPRGRSAQALAPANTRPRGVVERDKGTMIRRTLYFSETVGRKLKAYAGEHGLDMSEIADEAVGEWLRARGVDV